jgi:hypothetical protein
MCRFARKKPWMKEGGKWNIIKGQIRREKE